MAIGDGILRDRPIYVRACRYGMREPEMCWYVIEEKPSGGDLSPSSTTTSESDSDDDDKVGEEVILECRSESDTIRRLSLPNSPLRHNSLAVLGSHIYLIGGDIITESENEDEKNIGYRHLELGGNRSWDLRGGRLVRGQFGAAAVGRDGFIYSVGCGQYRLSPDTGILHKLPQLSFPNSQYWERYSEGFSSHLLALTNSKLFVYVTLTEYAPSLMLSYDFETGLWDHNYDRFSGYWSAGVVLYGERYLFAFGTQNPTSPQYPVEELVAGIYVFDIQERKWLPEPVKGLPNNGTVLPTVFKTEGPDRMEYNIPCYTQYLFQVRKENDHKLGLLWDSREGVEPHRLLNWSKFIINPITIDDAATVEYPHFYVSSLSNGTAPLDEGTYEVFNCAAGM